MTVSSPQTRTNVASRKREPQEDLLRWFVGPDETPWPDWTGKARVPGRSAYTERTIGSIREAAKTGGFARGFRTNISADAETLVLRAQEAGVRAWFSRLGLANRAGVLAVGDAASREGSRTAGWLLILADDAGKSTAQKYEAQATRKGATVVRASGHALGRALGREYVSVVTVQASPFKIDLQSWALALDTYPDSGLSVSGAKGPIVAGSKSRSNSVSAPGLSEKECQRGSTK